MDKNDKDLIAWYRCEDVTGNSLVNEIGGTNNATLTDVTLTSGGSPHGKSAISFNGTTSKGTISAGTNWFANAGIQTVCLWFKANKNSTLRTFFSHNETANNNRVYLRVDATDIIECVVGSTVVNIGTAASWTAGQWQHLAVVRDATNNKAWGYLNGNLLLSNSAITIGTPTADANVTIGMLATIDPFDGELDDIRVYNRFLTEAEVKYIMHGRAYFDKSFGMN